MIFTSLHQIGFGEFEYHQKSGDVRYALFSARTGMARTSPAAPLMSAFGSEAHAGLRSGHTDCSNVLISTFDSSVLCTGHLSAISINRLRCSVSSGPSNVIARSM